MLAHLPEELLLDIICRLQVDRDAHYTESNHPTAESRYRETKASIATLAALSLTCRVFHRLCTPTLYSAVVFRSPDIPDLRRICSVLLTLALKPSLAKHIRYIEHVLNAKPEPRIGSLDTGDLAFLRSPGLHPVITSTVTNAIHENNPDRWTPKLQKSIDAALVSLLICLSPNVEYLKLPILWEISRSIKEGCDRGIDLSAYDSAPPASKVQVVCIGSPTIAVEPGVWLSFLLSLEALPQLEHLQISMVSDHEMEQMPFIHLFNFSNLRTLDVRDAETDFRYLVQIIGSCPRLQRIACQFCTDDAPWFGDGNMDYNNSVDLPMVYNALRSRKETLYSITLRLHWIHYSCGVPALGTFADFPILTSLTVDTVSLLGTSWAPNTPFESPDWSPDFRPSFRISDRLPSTVESLGIINYHNIVDDALIFHDLIDDLLHAPKLRLITIYTESGLGMSKENNSSWPVLEARFAEKGVRLVHKKCLWGKPFD